MTAFVKGTGREVRIAAVDSGIHAAHPHVGGISGGVAISRDGLTDDFTDRLGHGTAVAAAIREKAPHAELFAVKIFETVLSAQIELLIRAIDWAVENQMHLVNLSLGTSNPEHERVLHDAVERATEAHTVIVAAREDAGMRWLPGSMPGVLPVLLDWDCPRAAYRFLRSDDGSVVFQTSGYPRPIPGVSHDRNLKGISFAVANLTGFAARILESNPVMGIDRLIELLADIRGQATHLPGKH